MGYFSNGTEGECYREKWCDRCVHAEQERADPDAALCAVWTLHLLHSYEDCNKPTSMLHVLIPRGNGTTEPWNKQCRMFIPVAGQER